MKSAQEIYEQMCSDFEDSCGILINDSSEMAVRMRAAAEQIYSLYVYNDWVLRQCFPHSAAGEYLDYHAMMRNITRKPAQKAHGQLHFRLETPSDTDTPIPEGTVCMTLSGIEFETIQAAFIAAGEYYADVPAIAVNAGSGGNAAQSTIIFMTSPPAGVFACTNLQRFTGGSDEETDEELRKRILSTYAALPSGANTGYYEKLVLDFEEVSAVKVLPKARGLGTVDIVFTSIEGIPDEKLIEEVKQCIEENREISFKIDNAWDIEPFKNECVPVIENEMGLKVTLDDGGWSEVVKSYSSVQKLAAVKISLLCCVTLASTIFVVYLFISRKRKDYAVMRALGTTKSSAGAAMLIPLIAVTAFGVAVGTAAGLIYTVQARQINELFETFTDYMPSTQVPLWPLIVCILGEAAAVILFACIMLYKLGKTPPLALLSDNHGKAKKTVQNQKQNTAESTGVFKAVSASINKPAVGIPAEPLIIHNRRCAVRFYIKYIFLHIKRSFLKSILTVVVAVLMSAAIMQYVQMMQTYLQLRESTVVTPKFVDLLPLYKLTMLEQDGFAENVYYAKTLLADVHIGTEYFERAMTITNDVSRYTMEECDIEYADGFDESCWDSVADIVFIGKYYNEHYGIKPGDKIKISPQGKMRDIMIMFNFERFEPAIDEICEEMTVAGVISTESGAFDDSLFTPGTLETVSTLGCGNLMNIAEFNLTDNTLVTQMREYGEQMQKSTNGTFIMDTSKLENVINTSEVLQRLYPAVIAAAIIIGSFMCSLIIFQSAKEAAIMRVLGTTRRSTGVIIAAEQIILVFVGLVLATAAMVLLKKQALLDVSDKVIMFEVLYIAAATAVSAVSSAITTKKNILELLQTKE